MSDVSSVAAVWMRQWRAAGPALEELRRNELGRLTDEEALAAADELLAIGASMPLPVERIASSGLVKQQALLHRRRGR